MNVLPKKIIAVLLVVALCVVYFVSCGVKDDGANSSADSAEQASSAEASEGSVNGGSSSETSEGDQSKTEEAPSADSSEVSNMNGNSSEERFDSSEQTNNSSEAPDNSSSSVSSEEDSSNSAPSEDGSSEDSSEDSSVAPPPVEDSSEDSSVAPPPVEDSSEDSSVAPPPVEDSSEDSSVAPPPVEDSSEDSSVAPPPVEDSSEESSYVPSSPADPITPIPEALYADPIDSHFNNSVFLGYSIMMHFGRYVGQWRTTVDSTIMGNSINVGAVGISFWSNSQQTPSMSSNSLPRYRGQAYNFEDLPAATGCTTMYIGLTCYSEMKVYADPQSAANQVIEGVNKIKAKNPNVTIVLLAGTYNTGTFEQLGSKYATRLSNTNIRKFNNYVLSYCNANGVDFVDVATPLTNGYGYMPIEYSSDNDYHIAQDAFLIWIDVLRDYARKKEAGTWRNLTVMPTLGA